MRGPHPWREPPHPSRCPLRSHRATLSHKGRREKCSTDLPDGLLRDFAVQSCLQKYFRSHLTQISSRPSPSRPPEGRIAIVTDAGCDAVDAAALGARCDRRAGWRKTRERSTARSRTTIAADGKAVWSWHPLLVLNSRRRVGPTGLRQTLIR